MNRLTAILVCLTFLSACSNDSSDANIADILAAQASFEVTGGGVKGPLANAVVEAYAVDTTQTSLAGELLGSGRTGSDAAIEELTIPGTTTGLILLVFSADDETTDITTGAAPLVAELRTIVSAEAIATGNVYATPLTTMATSIALARADSNAPPFMGNGDGTVTAEELEAALVPAGRMVIASFGFGMTLDTDLFAARPILTDGDESTSAQRAVLGYRQAVEALSAIIALAVDDAEANNAATTLDAEATLAALASDLADGTLDGNRQGTPIDAFSDISDIANIAATDTSLLAIPGTERMVTDIAAILAEEIGTTGVMVDVTSLERGELVAEFIPARLRTDIDGDGVPDASDAFPLDAAVSVDTDGDGIGNAVDPDDDNDDVADEDDAFPLDDSEVADTDGDGVGNNADDDDDGDGTPDASDALPLNARASSGNAAEIGPDGGEITSEDGRFTLTVPAGALSNTTLISVGSLNFTAFNADQEADEELEARYVLEPSGLVFSTPANFSWQLPTDSATGQQLRTAVLINDDVGEVPGNLVLDLTGGELTGEVSHFSEIAIRAAHPVFDISKPAAIVGETLNWEYGWRIEGEGTSGTIWQVNTEGAVFIDDAKTGFSLVRQPELLLGEDVVTDPQHVDPIILTIDQTAETNAEQLRGKNEGLITAVCTAGSEAGLPVRIGFNIDWENTNVIGPLVLFGEGSGRMRVEQTGTCFDTVVVEETRFYEVGDGIDRITVSPEPPYKDVACSEQTYLVASGERNSFLTADGSCRYDLGAGEGTLGALHLLAEATDRILVYTLRFTTVGRAVVETFVRLFGNFGNPQPTTDANYCVNDDGVPDYGCAYRVESGTIERIDADQDDNIQGTTVYNSFAQFHDNLISYAPVTSTTGIGITSSADSRAFFIDLETETHTDIMSVGDTALNVRCSRMAPATVGCAATAYGEDQVYPFIVNLDGQQFQVANTSIPTVSVSTPSPFVVANGDGDYVLATADDTASAGSVNLNRYNADGDLVENVTILLGDVEEVPFGAEQQLNAIVLAKPSAKYPNGAIILSVNEVGGDGDGMLVIPATEALLGGVSPAVFFGPAFDGDA